MRRPGKNCLAALLAWLSFLVPAGSRAEDRVGRIYELDRAADGPPLFLQKIHRERTAAGRTVSDSTIEDAAGQILMTEHAELDGDRILTQRVEQRQIGEAYELERKEGVLHFRTFRLASGKRELVSEKTQRESADFITGPATEPFLAKRLGSRDDLNADFGIFELEKSVGFEFQRKGELEGGRVVKIRLRPQSFWLSLLLAPIDMEFDAKTFTLRRYKGRTPLRHLVHGTWKPLDAQITYADK